MASFVTFAAANGTYAKLTDLASYQTTESLAAYLLSATAASTYAPIASLSAYLTTASAAAIYLTMASASSTYLTMASASSTYLAKAGGAMTGAIAMGANKITGLAAGTVSGDAARYDELAAETAARKLGDGPYQNIAGVVYADWTGERATLANPAPGIMTVLATTGSRNCYAKRALNVGNDSSILYRMAGGLLSNAGGVSPVVGYQLDGGTVVNGWAFDVSKWYRITEAGMVPVYTAMAGLHRCDTMCPMAVTIAAGALTSTPRTCALVAYPDGFTAVPYDSVTAAPDRATFGSAAFLNNTGHLSAMLGANVS